MRLVRPFKDVMRRLLAMRPIPYVVMLGTEREENLIYILSVLSVRASPLWVAL
jgi:hypothetical protein